MGSALVKSSRRDTLGNNGNPTITNRSHVHTNNGSYGGQNDEWHKVDPLTGPTSNYCKPVNVISPNGTLDKHISTSSGKTFKPSNIKKQFFQSGEHACPAPKNHYSGKTSLPSINAPHTDKHQQSSTGRGDSHAPGLPPIVTSQKTPQKRRKFLSSYNCVSRQGDKTEASNNVTPSSLAQQNESDQLQVPKGVVSNSYIDDQDVSRDARTPSPEFNDFENVIVTDPTSLKIPTSVSSPVDLYTHSKSPELIKETSPAGASVTISNMPAPLHVGERRLALNNGMLPKSSSTELANDQYRDLIQQRLRQEGAGSPLTPSEKSVIVNEVSLQSEVEAGDSQSIKSFNKTCILKNDEGKNFTGKDYHAGENFDNQCADDNAVSDIESNTDAQSLSPTPKTRAGTFSAETNEKTINNENLHFPRDDALIKNAECGDTLDTSKPLKTTDKAVNNIDNLVTPMHAFHERNEVVYTCTGISQRVPPLSVLSSLKGQIKGIGDTDSKDILSSHHGEHHTETKSNALISDLEGAGNLSDKLNYSEEDNEVGKNHEISPKSCESNAESELYRNNKSEADVTSMLNRETTQLDKEKQRPSSWSHIGASQNVEELTQVEDLRLGSAAKGDGATYRDDGAYGAVRSVSRASSTTHGVSPSPSNISLSRRQTSQECVLARPDHAWNNERREEQVLKDNSQDIEEKISSEKLRSAESSKSLTRDCVDSSLRPGSAQSERSSSRMQKSRPSSAQSVHNSERLPTNGASRQSLTHISTHSSRHNLSRSLSNHSSTNNVLSPRPPSADTRSHHSPRPPSTDCGLRHSPRPPSTNSVEGGPRKVSSRLSVAKRSSSLGLTSTEQASNLSPSQSTSKTNLGLSSSTDAIKQNSADFKENTSLAPLSSSLKLPPIRAPGGLPNDALPSPGNWTALSQQVRLPPVIRPTCGRPLPPVDSSLASGLGADRLSSLGTSWHATRDVLGKMNDSTEREAVGLSLNTQESVSKTTSAVTDILTVKPCLSSTSTSNKRPDSQQEQDPKPSPSGSRTQLEGESKSVGSSFSAPSEELSRILATYLPHKYGAGKTVPSNDEESEFKYDSADKNVLENKPAKITSLSEDNSTCLSLSEVKSPRTDKQTHDFSKENNGLSVPKEDELEGTLATEGVSNEPTLDSCYGEKVDDKDIVCDSEDTSAETNQTRTAPDARELLQKDKSLAFSSVEECNSSDGKQDDLSTTNKEETADSKYSTAFTKLSAEQNELVKSIMEQYSTKSVVKMHTEDELNNTKEQESKEANNIGNEYNTSIFTNHGTDKISSFLEKKDDSNTVQTKKCDDDSTDLSALLSRYSTKPDHATSQTSSRVASGTDEQDTSSHLTTILNDQKLFKTNESDLIELSQPIKTLLNNMKNQDEHEQNNDGQSEVTPVTGLDDDTSYRASELRLDSDIDTAVYSEDNSKIGDLSSMTQSHMQSETKPSLLDQYYENVKNNSVDAVNDIVTKTDDVVAETSEPTNLEFKDQQEDAASKISVTSFVNDQDDTEKHDESAQPANKDTISDVKTKQGLENGENMLPTKEGNVQNVPDTCIAATSKSVNIEQDSEAAALGEVKLGSENKTCYEIVTDTSPVMQDTKTESDVIEARSHKPINSDILPENKESHNLSDGQLDTSSAITHTNIDDTIAGENLKPSHLSSDNAQAECSQNPEVSSDITPQADANQEVCGERSPDTTLKKPSAEEPMLACQPETLPTEKITAIKQQIYEEGLKPCQRDGGVAFFIPVSNTGMQPPNANADIGDRLAKPKRSSMSYEERMMMADINRHAMLSKKKEFAVKDLINVKSAAASSASASNENINGHLDRTDRSDAGSSHY